MARSFKLGEPQHGKPKPAPGLAAVNPVARVVLDTPVPHLAREFDYAVPEPFDAAAQPGVRVKVTFGRQNLDGFITARLAGPFENEQIENDEDQKLPRRIQTIADLTPLKKIISPESVLQPQILELSRRVANYYAGTLPDVLRFAIPPRHARAETTPRIATEIINNPAPILINTLGPTRWLTNWLNSWNQYQNASQLFDTLTSFCIDSPAAGKYPSFCGSAQRAESAESIKRSANSPIRFVWTSLPGLAAPIPPETVPSQPLWAAQIAALVAQLQTAVSGNEDQNGILIIAPDLSDVTRIQSALYAAGVQNVIRLMAEDGPEKRYQSFLAIERGLANVVIGTRSAVFAPVKNLKLMILWGDGDESLIEQHSPQYNAREVLAMRSELENIPLIVGAIGRTVAAQAWVETGQAISIVGYRDAIRERAPLTRAIDSAATAAEGYLARVPTAATQTIRQALANGPVLIQVPLTGYLPRFDCLNCGLPARCESCGGPLAIPDNASRSAETYQDNVTSTAGVPNCRTCGQLAPGWRCPNCSSNRIHAAQKGADRTAEEFGRTFPGAQIIVSTSSAPGGVKRELPRPKKPGIVIATPGAEPVMPGGYSVALILDAAATIPSSSRDISTEALAQWLAVGHLVVPAASGGRLLLIGNADPNATAALVRFDPVLLASRDFAERIEAGLPPVVRFAQITGDASAVNALTGRISLATPETMLGPVPIGPMPDDAAQIQTKSRALNRPLPNIISTEVALFTEPQVQVLLRVPQADGLDLARQLRASVAARAAKREGGQLRVRLDPPEFS